MMGMPGSRTRREDDDAAELERAELRVVDMVGNMMEFWGFKRPMGRVWTLLYLSPEPLVAADIAERLQMSAGNVSMTLSELTKWGAARKTWRPGDRRDFYQAETSVWKMVTRVMRERELLLVREAGEAFAHAGDVAQAQAAGRPRSDPERARLQFIHERAGQLRALAAVGEKLIESIVAGEPVDPAPLKEGSERKDG